MRSAASVALALALPACASDAVILALPAGHESAASIVLAVEGDGEAPRLYAGRLGEPFVLRLSAAAPARAQLMFLSETLEALLIEPGRLIDTPDGRLLPEGIATYEARIDPDLEARWSSVEDRPAIFDSIHIPEPAGSCRNIPAESFSLEVLRGRELRFAAPLSEELLLVGTLDGSLYAVTSTLGVRAMRQDGEGYITAMSGEVIGTGDGRTGAIAAGPDGRSVTVTYSGLPLPDGAMIGAIARAGDDQLAVLAGGTDDVWLRAGGSWVRLHHFPTAIVEQRGLRAAPGGGFTAFRSPSRYVFDVDAIGQSQTATVGLDRVTALQWVALDRTETLYAGDFVGRIHQRLRGRWEELALTEIADPILDLIGARGRLIYIGTDGWTGSYVPDYGLCPQGPIMPFAFLSARWGARAVFFGDTFAVAIPIE